MRYRSALDVLKGRHVWLEQGSWRTASADVTRVARPSGPPSPQASRKPMSPLANRQWKLVARPDGPVKRSDFEWVTDPVPPLATGQVLVRVLYVSLDPAMRGWMTDRRSYIPPVGWAT